MQLHCGHTFELELKLLYQSIRHIRSKITPNDLTVSIIESHETKQKLDQTLSDTLFVMTWSKFCPLDSGPQVPGEVTLNLSQHQRTTE